jgi:hypothetical protein
MRLRRSLSLAAVLFAACYYPYPDPSTEVHWVDTSVGKAVAIGGAVREPRTITRVNPEPTNTAGYVQAKLIIGENGSVKKVDILSATDDAAANSARAALMQWKFAPTFVGSGPVPVVYDVKLTFKKP